MGQGNVFTGVCLSTGGRVLPQCMPGYHPQREQTPPWTRHPPGADTPRSRPPGTRHPPREQTLPEADASIWSMNGRYASYWNAFLFYLIHRIPTRSQNKKVFDSFGLRHENGQYWREISVRCIHQHSSVNKRPAAVTVISGGGGRVNFCNEPSGVDTVRLRMCEHPAQWWTPELGHYIQTPRVRPSYLTVYTDLNHSHQPANSTSLSLHSAAMNLWIWTLRSNFQHEDTLCGDHLQIHFLLYGYWLFKNNFGGHLIRPFCGAIDTHVLDFWRRLP